VQRCKKQEATSFLEKMKPSDKETEYAIKIIRKILNKGKYNLGMIVMENAAGFIGNADFMDFYKTKEKTDKSIEQLDIINKSIVEVLTCIVRLYNEVGIVHNDMNADNAMMKLYNGKPIVRIIDFGRITNVKQPPLIKKFDKKIVETLMGEIVFSDYQYNTRKFGQDFSMIDEDWLRCYGEFRYCKDTIAQPNTNTDKLLSRYQQIADNLNKFYENERDISDRYIPLIMHPEKSKEKKKFTLKIPKSMMPSTILKIPKNLFFSKKSGGKTKKSKSKKRNTRKFRKYTVE